MAVGCPRQAGSLRCGFRAPGCGGPAVNSAPVRRRLGQHGRGLEEVRLRRAEPAYSLARLAAATPGSGGGPLLTKLYILLYTFLYR